ncbi:MAG: amidase [Rhodospirillales bacterium]|jgi:aspartyl-tRNA(Asn)/glutamyl-tRNA(Gln) amidotransferase subunit A|nr:amidase [Rhodospirillales bacterium]MDP6883656.1 amidase [Rhodospirillales bacterium]
MTTDLDYLTIAEGAARIRSGDLSPVDWTRHLITRIESLDPTLHAFALVTAEHAMDQAHKAEAEIAAGNYRGPLHGVPFALKDIYDTAGIATTGQSKVCAGRVPERDATSVRLLKDAGAVLLGKLTTHEFAYGGPSFDLPGPPARNPWDTDRFTGGSSSGSGAAVAAGMVPAAMGSCTGGSIRTPAAYCGIAGLKPTAGLVSRAGVLPLSYSLDTCGPMAWTVADCALMLQVLAGYDPEDGQSADSPIPDYHAALTGDIEGLRIGVVRHFWEVDKTTDPAVAAALDAALGVLAGLGAEIQDVTLSPLDDFAACQWVIACAEANAIHDDNLRHRTDDYGENFRYRILPGIALGAVDYVQALRQRRQLIAEVDAVLKDFDVLFTATTPIPPPLLADDDLVSILATRGITTAFNTTGGPALALCCGFTDDGLPLSATLGGKAFDDALVMRVGHAYEGATEWRRRRPDLGGGGS